MPTMTAWLDEQLEQAREDYGELEKQLKEARAALRQLKAWQKLYIPMSPRAQTPGDQKRFIKAINKLEAALKRPK